MSALRCDGCHAQFLTARTIDGLSSFTIAGLSPAGLAAFWAANGWVRMRQVRVIRVICGSRPLNAGRARYSVRAGLGVDHIFWRARSDAPYPACFRISLSQHQPGLAALAISAWSEFDWVVAQEEIFLKEPDGCHCLCFDGTITHGHEFTLARIAALSHCRRAKGPHSDTRKIVEPAQGLGRSRKLAGFLRHVLAADLRHGAQGRSVRRRGVCRT